jgi:NDP-sugar pyrophosphorylase family protein
VIETDDGLVRNYIEKPALRYQVSMGIYVYDERALNHLPEGPCQFPELVLRLLAAGERVAAYQCDADWYDIGTVGEYERASADVERFPEKYGMEPSLPSPPDLYPVETQRDLDDNRLHPAGHAAAATVRGGRSSS